MGTSAWATDVNGTLVHTAGAKWGSNSNVASTVDAEKEAYNLYSSSGWAGSAYAKFSFSIPSGKTIESATLTYAKLQYNNKTYSDGIYYMNAEFDIDWDNFAGQTNTDLRYSEYSTLILTTASHQGTKDTGTEHTGLTADVTSAVRAIYGAGQNYIIFQWSGNQGSADLYGKGANAAKQPKLSITYTDEALYTATFTETNSLNPTVTIYSDADRTSSVTNGSLRDKTTYYYRATLDAYEDYEGSFTVDGANPSINYMMTAREAVSSLKVYAKIGEDKYLIKTIDLDDKYVGDQVTFCYPRLWLVGTTLYETTQEAHTSKEYYKWSNYTLAGNSVEIEYNTTFATNVVYFSEGENITGMTADASGNADIRCSDGQGGRSAEELSLTSLGVGQYKLGSRVWGNTGVSYTYKAAGGEILTHALTGALDDKTVCFNVVSGTAAITVQGSTDTGSKVLDYVYIQKLGEEDGLIYNGNFDNSTWDKGWNGTGTTKSMEFVKQNTSQRWANDNFAEMWTDGSFSAEANLNQILVNVPAGSYTLSADILNNVTSSGGVLYAKVGNASDVTTAAEDGSGSHESVSFTVAEKSNIVVGFKTTAINTKKGWIAMDNFELEQTAVSAAITSAGWATFSSAYDLDFSTPITGLTAYKAVSCDGNTVTLEEVTGKVKAGDGLVIKGAQGTYPIPVTTDASTVYTNSENINMWGYNGNATKTVEKATTGTNYVLSIQSGNVVFAPIGDVSATLNPGQAALWVENVGGARVLNIVFADEATAISAVQNSKEQSDEVYNLAGQRVAQPTKGLYIVNGKKVIMK